MHMIHTIISQDTITINHTIIIDNQYVTHITTGIHIHIDTIHVDIADNEII